MKVKISVIVPVYNAEEYLRRTLDSICRQSLQELQIILVNDGSLDSSLHICKEYEKKDNRIIVINKTNGGVASARNEGLKVVVGKYTIHADADDRVLDRAYERFYKKAESEQADIVVGDFLVSGKNRKNKVHSFSKGFIKREDFLKGILRGEIHGSLCNKLIRSKLCKNESFINGLDFMEDVLMLMNISQKKEIKISGLGGNPIYEYIQHTNSYTNSISKSYLEKGVSIVRKMEEVLGNDDCNYEAELDVMKFNFKILYLLNTNTKQLNISNVFPEINNKILRISDVSFKFKFLVLLENLNIHIFSVLYKKLKNIYYNRIKEN